MEDEEASGAVEYALEVDALRKEFKVYHRRYSSIKTQVIAAVTSALQPKSRDAQYDIRVALKGVSFKIRRGQTAAIIGRNGSGKSTLLSILARIYYPTEGSAVIRGRLIAMLELGAGFDLDLTGNQNLVFNSTILGLSRELLQERYESICSFAELDQATMDLPVRMYSSGMQLRLGFAIATHLDNDIVLVDEGLAVGDEAFQEKCFKKMEQFKAEGRTVVIVSHELDHVERLADRVIWLDKGEIRMDGGVSEVIAAYLKSVAPVAAA